MSIIIATAYMLFGAAQSIGDSASARAIAADSAQSAIDKMGKELRQAIDNTSTDDQSKDGAFTIAESRRVQFCSDVNGDGKPEQVTYYISGTSLMRTVAPASNDEPIWTFGAAGTPTVLVKRVDASSGAIFCYHSNDVPATPVACASGQQHGFTIVNAANPWTTDPKISLVGIHLVNSESQGGKEFKQVSDALIRLRASQNGTGVK
jgi:hypothetical protein